MQEPSDDKKLIKGISNSDRAAYKEIFYKYQPALFRYIFYKTNHYSLAQDIVQDTFLKVWVNRKTLKPELSFFSFIAKISTNLVKDHYRKKQVRDKYKSNESLKSDSTNVDVENNLDHTVLLEEIQKVVNEHLPQKCKTIFILSRIEGKSNQEIADIFNISKKTVENQLYQALKVLRKKLKNFL